MCQILVQQKRGKNRNQNTRRICTDNRFRCSKKSGDHCFIYFFNCRNVPFIYSILHHNFNFVPILYFYPLYLVLSNFNCLLFCFIFFPSFSFLPFFFFPFFRHFTFFCFELILPDVQLFYFSFVPFVSFALLHAVSSFLLCFPSDSVCWQIFQSFGRILRIFRAYKYALAYHDLQITETWLYVLYWTSPCSTLLHFPSLTIICFLYVDDYSIKISKANINFKISIANINFKINKANINFFFDYAFNCSERFVFLDFLLIIIFILILLGIFCS